MAERTVRWKSARKINVGERVGLETRDGFVYVPVAAVHHPDDREPVTIAFDDGRQIETRPGHRYPVRGP